MLEVQLRQTLVMPAWGKLAFGFVVVQGLVVASVDPRSSLTRAQLAALACVVGLYMSIVCIDRLRDALAGWRLLTLLHGLGLALPWLGQGYTAMSGLSAVSLSGLMLPGLKVLLPAALHALNVLAACRLTMPGVIGELMTYTFASAVVFVMAFTRLVARELELREQLDVASRALAAHAETAEELATMRERTRIARELHDSLGHALTAAHVHAQVAERDLAGDLGQAKQALQTVQDIVRAGLEELRQTVRALPVAPTEQAGLERALERLVQAHRSAALATSLEVLGARRALSDHLALPLYRVAQEALTNTVKHARARRATVVLQYGASDLALRVRDDGVGLGHDAREGFGLGGIRARVAALDGQLTLRDDGGLCLEVRIPL